MGAIVELPASCKEPVFKGINVTSQKRVKKSLQPAIHLATELMDSTIEKNKSRC